MAARRPSIIGYAALSSTRRSDQKHNSPGKITVSFVPNVCDTSSPAGRRLTNVLFGNGFTTNDATTVFAGSPAILKLNFTQTLGGFVSSRRHYIDFGKKAFANRRGEFSKYFRPFRISFAIFRSTNQIERKYSLQNTKLDSRV